MQCSDAELLARHLGEFGEIKITRLEPETTVAWEGEHASGTVHLEPSGWGTRVIITTRCSSPEPTGVLTYTTASPGRRPLRQRLMDTVARFLSSAPPPPRPAAPVVQSVTLPQPVESDIRHDEALATALESLGQAHHRPFSRS